MEGGEVEATKGTVEEREVGGLGGAGHVLLAPRIFFSLQSLSWLLTKSRVDTEKGERPHLG